MPVTTPKKKYHELADHLRDRIRKGDLKVGERLPTYTELYDVHGASTATVQRACDLLHREQLIERRHGSGIYVAAPQKASTGTIGIIGSAGFKAEENPFCQHLMRAVHEAVEEDGRQLLYLGKEDAWYLSEGAKVDGVLICAVEEFCPVPGELPADLPKVSLLTSLQGVTSVGVDEYRGAQMATRYLLDKGHRRIAVLMEKQAWEGRRRVAGYADALQERGIEADPGWKRLVEQIDKQDSQPYWSWAHEQMRAWLRDGWRETGCTAILAQNDMAAAAVVQILHKEGIRVPEDVSVMGFDGTEICDFMSPRLHSVALPLLQIGATAMELLGRQMAGEPSRAETVLLPVHIREGQSVAQVTD